MVTGTRVVAVEVAAVGFGDGLVGCGDMTEKVVKRMFSIFLWRKQLEEWGCHYSLGEDDRTSRLESEETRSLVWGRLSIRWVLNIYRCVS